LQIKAALNAVESVFQRQGERRPVMVSVTMETTGTMLVGSDINAVLTILQPYPIDILGLNCATGPDRMAEHIRYLSAHSPFVVSLYSQCWSSRECWRSCPLPADTDGVAAGADAFYRRFGVQVIGGCCGTRPDHIKQLAEIAQTLKPKDRQPNYEPAAASIYGAQPYEQDNSF
jgi:5-methyltetrahydrofolate--homocysteine methyltransferase